MSIKTIHVCDSCNKELKGRLTFKVCPCCNNEICLECWGKSGTPREVKKPDKVTDTPGKCSISLRGIFWDGDTRQHAVDGFVAQVGAPISQEEADEIAVFLEGETK
jgi:hypothetical protein